jgi:hypothetical protein
MAKFKEARRQNRTQKKHSSTQKEVRRRQRTSWDKFVTNLEHETYRTQPKVCKISNQICKDIKKQETFKETDENVSVQYYEKLWNTRNINDPELEWHSNNNLDTLIILD